MKRLFAVAPLLTLIGVLPIHGASIAYNDPAGQGTQAWGGNLALTFDVLSPVTVTALGVFNASGTGVITGPIQVVIYDTVSNTQVTPVVTFDALNGPYLPEGFGFDVFLPISPVYLGVGHYQVDAVGFGPNDLNGNLNAGSTSGPTLTGGGVLNFTGAAWDSSPVLDAPLTCSSCQGAPQQFQQFDAGTFQFTAGVPEPATLGMLGFGFVGLSVLLRRKRVR